ncbi:MAG: hypothetical protein ORN21_03395, partial [Methylophilaceae bacterium]|nr:hypothetical protein [Methylophilaceae bacterium]
ELPHSLIAIGHELANHFVDSNKMVGKPKNAHKVKKKCKKEKKSKKMFIIFPHPPLGSKPSQLSRECAHPLGLFLFLAFSRRAQL